MSFEQHSYHLAPDPRLDHFEALLRRTRDLGNLEVTGEVESNQRTLGETLAPHLDHGTL